MIAHELTFDQALLADTGVPGMKVHGRKSKFDPPCKDPV